MNLTFDLPIVVGTHPRKAQESRVREMARRGRDMARHSRGDGVRRHGDSGRFPPCHTAGTRRTTVSR